jgi:RNA polymerase sigma-70 factor (ECF subfamily)
MNIQPLRRRAPAPDAPLSDEALARACAAGDAAAVAALFDRFHAVVGRYLARLIGRGVDVDDLLQSTFLEVARGAARYDEPRGNVRTWLFAIATNVARHHRRAISRRLRLHDAVAHEPRGAGIDPSGEADARLQLARAEQALAALGDELREAFVLCELESLSAAEAARVVGASETAVWKRVSKARQALRAAVLRAKP